MDDQTRKLLADLLKTQRLAVLATEGRDGPYTSLMQFAATADFKNLIFASRRVSRKYENIASDARVALLIDDRPGGRTSSRPVTAATATGKAEEVSGEERKSLLKLFLLKHPDLEAFTNSPECAVLKCVVETYVIVKRFEDVIVVHP